MPRITVTVDVNNESVSRAFMLDKADPDASIEEINEWILDRIYSNNVDEESPSPQAENP